jgi:mono/diheme cytochrome c family protein
MKLGITYSAVLAGVVFLAVMTAGAPAKHLSKADQALFNKGKSVFSNRHCDSCHGADLKGEPGVAPSLLPSGPLSHYTSDTFMTLMTTNVGYDGKKMAVPMAGKISTDDIKALYVFLSNQ